MKEGNQDRFACCADYRVSTRIGRIRSGIAHFGQPRRIRYCPGIIGCRGIPDGCDWPPEVVGVFGVVEGNYAVCECQVKKCEKASALGGGKPEVNRRRLSDLIPIVLNCAIPETSGKRLICRGGRAIRY